jgi:hypothetical protein
MDRPGPQRVDFFAITHTCLQIVPGSPASGGNSFVNFGYSTLRLSTPLPFLRGRGVFLCNTGCLNEQTARVIFLLFTITQ